MPWFRFRRAAPAMSGRGSIDADGKTTFEVTYRHHVSLERTHHMADSIVPGKKARVLVAGQPITAAGFTSATSSDETVFVVRVQEPDGFWRVYPVAAGTATLTVDINGHKGTDEVTVAEAPLVVTLDTPEDA